MKENLIAWGVRAILAFISVWVVLSLFGRIQAVSLARATFQDAAFRFESLSKSKRDAEANTSAHQSVLNETLRLIYAQSETGEINAESYLESLEVMVQQTGGQLEALQFDSENLQADSKNMIERTAIVRWRGTESQMKRFLQAVAESDLPIQIERLDVRSMRDAQNILRVELSVSILLRAAESDPA